MFTNSFGLLLLFQGVATLIGPPIVGKHKDDAILNQKFRGL